MSGWLPLIILPVAVLLVTPAAWPCWATMWLLVGAVWAGLKWLSWRRRPAGLAPWWKHLAYLFAWPGLDAAAFLSSRPAPREARPSAREWTVAAATTLLGTLILFQLAPLLAQPWLRGAAGMIGILLVFHSGLFHLLSCLWRWLGIDAQPILNSPLCSSTITDFWSRRWNTAFRDVMHRFLFRPLADRLGPRAALLVAFVISGLVHELVISVPAGSGYGGPTLYFLLQAVAIRMERSAWSRARPNCRHTAGWLFMLVVVLGPAILLFHPPFLGKVMAPFVDILSAAIAGQGVLT